MLKASYTFWGRGVSQGHSDAIRRIHGVLDARQYTCPKEEYLEAIRQGQTPDMDAYKGHLRDCYVVAAPDADKAAIEQEIKTMEKYFVGYETRHVIEYSLKLDSNPEFTGAVLTAYARGIYRLSQHGGRGCFTVFDIAPAWISPETPEELRAHSL